MHRMGLHIGAHKHASCFDQVFLGSSFLPKSNTLMRNQHVCDLKFLYCSERSLKTERHRVPRHFWTLQSRHYAEQKTHQCVLRDCFEKKFEEKTSFYLVSKKRNLAHSHFFWVWVSITNLFAKRLKSRLSRVHLASRCKHCRNYTLRFHWYTHCF